MSTKSEVALDIILKMMDCTMANENPELTSGEKLERHFDPVKVAECYNKIYTTIKH